MQPNPNPSSLLQIIAAWPLGFINFVHRGYGRFLETQQMRMANNFDGLPLLALLGLICGVLSGGIIVLFRLAMDGVAQDLLPNGNIESFELLTGLQRFILCVGGGLLVGIILHLLKPKFRQVGVVHVIERLDYHQGRLSIRNALVQFFTASIALLSGQSVGREGPSIHLGAAGGSILGRMLRVPNNSVRILVGCGVAAAIAAAFNTPLAGVIFAMEVVIMDYTVIGFTPVIIAAVSATTLTRLTFGDASAFSFAPVEISSVFELPIVAIMGAIIGCLAAGFIQLSLLINSLFSKEVIWARTTLAGLITGAIAFTLPQIMGTGYDTVDQILLADVGLPLVILLTLAKIVATASAVGLGVPAGLIGPTLFIGATAGSAIGLGAAHFFPTIAASSSYALLGMAAMMAATLQAPLAALVYLLELTANQSVILPAMTAVITASLVTRAAFGKSSIYRHLMLIRGLDYRNSPLSKALRRIGVASVMDRQIIHQDRFISISQAEELLKQEPRWILLTDEQAQHKNSLLPATDLARYLNERSEAAAETEEVTDSQIDLLKIPAKRLDTSRIRIIDTLQEAYERMQSQQCEVLYITGAHGSAKEQIYGVITKKHIESSYRV